MSGFCYECILSRACCCPTPHDLSGLESISLGLFSHFSPEGSPVTPVKSIACALFTKQRGMHPSNGLPTSFRCQFSLFCFAIKSLPPLAPLFVPSGLPLSFLFKSLQPLFCKTGGSAKGTSFARRESPNIPNIKVAAFLRWGRKRLGTALPNALTAWRCGAKPNRTETRTGNIQAPPFVLGGSVVLSQETTRPRIRVGRYRIHWWPAPTGPPASGSAGQQALMETGRHARVTNRYAVCALQTIPASFPPSKTEFT